MQPGLLPRAPPRVLLDAMVDLTVLLKPLQYFCSLFVDIAPEGLSAISTSPFVMLAARLSYPIGEKCTSSYVHTPFSAPNLDAVFAVTGQSVTQHESRT
jgi:hypothetical protein